MLVSEGQDWLEGEEYIWNTLANIDPADVSRRAKVSYDQPSGFYALDMFNEKVYIQPRERIILSDSPVADFVLNELGYLSKLSILWYLAGAKDMPPSGELINPVNMSDGQTFFKGSHELPLAQIAQKYDCDIQGFTNRGIALGGEMLDYGDASFQVAPFPRVPTVLLIWKGDDEFPARADLLFDSTCPLHLPMDIIWSTAMITVMTILSYVNPNRRR